VSDPLLDGLSPAKPVSPPSAASRRQSVTDASGIGDSLPSRPRAASLRPGTDDLVASTIQTFTGFGATRKGAGEPAPVRYGATTGRFDCPWGEESRRVSCICVRQGAGLPGSGGQTRKEKLAKWTC
jgi:hypothetical protein